MSVADIEDQIAQCCQTMKLDKANADSRYCHIVTAAKGRHTRALRMARQRPKRIEILENERCSLSKAHLAGAVPIELLCEELTRIKDEPARAGALMANSEIHEEELRRDLRKALALATNLGSGYSKASEKVRRQMNHGIFEEIVVEVDSSVIYARPAQPFAVFHDEEFRLWLVESATNPGPEMARGPNNWILVDLGGHNKNRSQSVSGPTIRIG